MTKIVFGLDVPCGCYGGGIHAYHVEVIGYQASSGADKPIPIKRRVACSEHPCPKCGGSGIRRTSPLRSVQ